MKHPHEWELVLVAAVGAPTPRSARARARVRHWYGSHQDAAQLLLTVAWHEVL